MPLDESASAHKLTQEFVHNISPRDKIFVSKMLRRGHRQKRVCVPALLLSCMGAKSYY